MRENKFCHLTKVNNTFTRNYDISVIRRLLIVLRYLLIFQVFLNVSTCGLVYIYWLVDKQVACIFWIVPSSWTALKNEAASFSKHQQLYTDLYSNMPQKTWIFINNTEQQCCWQFRSSGMRCFVTGLVVPDVLKDCGASICKHLAYQDQVKHMFQILHGVFWSSPHLFPL
jgi:hypothetical protein